MAVFLSPFAGVGAQFLDNNGTILSGGKIFTYAAGTTTPLPTYTTFDGLTPHTNPIILDSAGRVPGGQLWLLSNDAYKFVLETAAGVLIGTYDNITASIESSDINFIQSGTGAVVTDVQDELRALFIRPEQFSSLAFADAAAVGQNRPLLLTGEYIIPADQTLSADLYFNGGQFSVAAGQTLTLRGQVVNKDTLSQLFSGAGSAVGLRYVRPEWFGAVRNGTANDSPALNRAWACVAGSAASRGDRPTIELASGSYGIGSTWRVAPTLSIPLEIIGQSWAVGGTRLQVIAGFDATSGDMALHIDGQTDAVQAIASYTIGGFAIIPRDTTGGGACDCAYQIGSASTTLIGVQPNEIHDIHVSDGFPVQTRIINARLIDFDRCSWWSRTLAGAVSIDFPSSATALKFAGDMNFNDCNLIGGRDTGVNVTLVRCNPSHSGYEVKGVRFNNSIFYKASPSVEISPSGGAIVGDWWFNAGCQFDGFQNAVITCQPTGAGTVLDDIHVTGVYIRGINVGFIAVNFVALSGARMDSIWVTGNWFANILGGSKAVEIVNGTNVHINDNNLTECDGLGADPMIVLNNVRSFTCNFNTLSQVTAITVSYLIALGTSTNYGSVVHNSTGGHAAVGPVQNLSAGAQLTLTPNW